MSVLIKKITIVLITIIMISNFIMPKYVFAADIGEEVVVGFFYLLSYVGDFAMSIMQDIMIGEEGLRAGSEFAIQYSPGIIFANEVPSLDINFLSPNDQIRLISNRYVNESDFDKETILDRMEESDTPGSLVDFWGNEWEENVEDYKKKYGAYNSSSIRMNININVSDYWNWNSIGQASIDIGLHELKEDYYAWFDENSGKAYLVVISGAYNVVAGKIGHKLYETQLTSSELSQLLSVAKIDNTINTTEVKKSIAGELQSNISTWYQALRTIALVGLLSVLVYIGIRIILSSSSAQDKAKYKNMLKDWLVAICILFVLHYIMAFMLGITGELNEIIKGNVIKQTAGGQKYDELISTVRNEYEETAEAGELDWDIAGYTVMYLALVILTGVFTIQYLKRVIFMAFLTMVAPMIALTYPLDKIKDGRAQAFSYWLREYIFNPQWRDRCR